MRPKNMGFPFGPRSKRAISPPRYAGRTDLIIRAALKTLGLDLPDLFRLMDLPSPMSGDDLSANRHTASAWIYICEVIHLNADCILYGYSPHEHRGRIRAAIEEGVFHLAEGPIVHALRLELIRDRDHAAGRR